MSTFTASVEATVEFTIELDESVWTPEAIEKWGNSFWRVSDAQDLAQSFARLIVSEGLDEDRFIEGLGRPIVSRSDSGRPNWGVWEFYIAHQKDDRSTPAGVTIRNVTDAVEPDWEATVWPEKKR